MVGIGHSDLPNVVGVGQTRGAYNDEHFLRIGQRLRPWHVFSVCFERNNGVR